MWICILDDMASSGVYRLFSVCQWEHVPSGYGAVDALLLMIQNTDLHMCVYFGQCVFIWE